jgi:lipid-binding SYLF domain-containing protein
MQSMLRRSWIAFIAALALGLACAHAADDKAQAKEKKAKEKQAKEVALLKEKVPAAKEAMLKQDSTLKKLFESSAGYVVFPNIGKGGFIFGGAHGKGLVYEDGDLIGLASMSQATVGAQIGGQVYREAIFFETKDALLTFKQSRVELSAQATAVAAAEGAAADAKYSEGVIIYTDPIKGLMAEASVGGQKFSFTPIED